MPSNGKDNHDLLRGSNSLRLDRHSHAVILPVLVLAHLRVGLRVIEAGVRIEGAQHPRDGAVVDHLAGLVAGQRIGVILRDQVVNIGEERRLSRKVDSSVLDCAPTFWSIIMPIRPQVAKK